MPDTAGKHTKPLQLRVYFLKHPFYMTMCSLKTSSLNVFRCLSKAVIKSWPTYSKCTTGTKDHIQYSFRHEGSLNWQNIYPSNLPETPAECL